MENIIVLPFSKREFKEFLKESMNEILNEKNSRNKSEDVYINLKDACEFLNLAKPTIYTLTSKRLIPFIKKGKKLYFKKSDLENWLNDGAKPIISEIDFDET
jgi:excisionase family DNA binding protein